MAADDNEGWDGIAQKQEDVKAPGRIPDLFEYWKNLAPKEDQPGSKTETGQPPSQGSMETSNPVTAGMRYYGFLDDEEIFETSTDRWRIRTYDCISEAIFWNVLYKDTALYRVLENRHNSASRAERKARKKLHDKLFESKYNGLDGAHQAIHFLDWLGDKGKSGEDGQTPRGWVLIGVKYPVSNNVSLEKGAKDGLTDALKRGIESEQPVNKKFQLCAPLITDAEVRSTEARILNEKWFDHVVPFLEEIFSLHHIPDADIWGDDPTPLEPLPPPIILSEGFALDDDMGLWPDRHFTGKKRPLDLEDIRQLPGREPKAHITGLGWFDIWIPTEATPSETQLYLLKEEDGGFWGFRLKIEGMEVQISETFSDGYNVKGYSDEMRTTSASVGQGMTVSSGSPLKPTEQPEPLKQTSEKVADSASDVDRSEAQTTNVSDSSYEPLRTPSKPNTKLNEVVKKDGFETVDVTRPPLQRIDNIQQKKPGKVSTSFLPPSRPSTALSSSSQFDKKREQDNKENIVPVPRRLYLR